MLWIRFTMWTNQKREIKTRFQRFFLLFSFHFSSVSVYSFCRHAHFHIRHAHYLPNDISLKIDFFCSMSVFVVVNKKFFWYGFATVFTTSHFLKWNLTWRWYLSFQITESVLFLMYHFICIPFCIFILYLWNVIDIPQSNATRKNHSWNSNNVELWTSKIIINKFQNPSFQQCNLE